MKDYYKILGVSKDASQGEIKKKYHKLAMEMHPDKLIGKSDAEKKKSEAKFQEITNAYEVLSNEKSRREYDSRANGGFSGFGGGMNSNEEFGSSSFFDEIFSDFFGGGKRSSQKSSSDSPRRGEDILIKVSISFKEFVFGANKKVSLDLLKSCPRCLQNGAYSKDDIKNCFSCLGRGVIDTFQKSIFGSIKTQSVCYSCKGLGKIITKKCSLCFGNKFISEKKIIDIKIPRGIKIGQRLRMKSMGNDGLYTSEKGDIFIEIKVKENNYFQRKNNDIHVSLPISFIDAILGNKVKVLTAEGVEDIEVPKCCQVGDKLILKRKGFFTDINKQERGDFYIWFDIKMPKKVGKETEQIFRKIYSNTSWDPNRDFIEKNKDILSD